MSLTALVVSLLILNVGITVLAAALIPDATTGRSDR